MDGGKTIRFVLESGVIFMEHGHGYHKEPQKMAKMMEQMHKSMNPMMKIGKGMNGNVRGAKKHGKKTY